MWVLLICVLAQEKIEEWVQSVQHDADTARTKTVNAANDPAQQQVLFILIYLFIFLKYQLKSEMPINKFFFKQLILYETTTDI